MSCGCSSNVPVSSPGSCTPVTGSTACAPRRVASPLTVPQTFSWVPRLRSAASGQLLVSDGCDEMMKLEAVISGPVWYDAQTGMATVVSGGTAWLQDNFACTPQPVFGFPAYGVDPGCHNSGDNPDREVAILRPQESSIGLPFGHLMGPPNQGMPREISPVHIVPADFPTTPPDDLFLWTFRELPPDDECSYRRYQWIKATASQAFSTAAKKLDKYDLPAGPLTADNDAQFGFAVWALEGGVFVLKKISNETFQKLITATNSAKWLDPGVVIFEQISQGTFSEATTVDLKTKPGYFEAAKEAVLFLRLVTNSPPGGGQIWINTFYVDNRQLFQGVGQPAESLQPLTSQITVPIPATKFLNLNFVKEIGQNGNLYPGNDHCGFVVTLQAFR